MKISIHNKLEIMIKDKQYTFYNTVLKSIREQLKSLKSYFNYLSIGTGSSETYTADFKLGNFISFYKLESEFLQSNPKSTMYVKKSVVINDNSLDWQYITEAGISAKINENPTIFNYFSLKNADFPNGIFKEAGEEIAISVTLYLEISNLSDCLLTMGNNPFVRFLLGEGIEGENIYCLRGKNLTGNTIIGRESFSAENKFPCEFSFSEDDDSLYLEFSFNMFAGEIYEVVLFVADTPFARINATSVKSPTTESVNITSSSHNTFTLGKDVKNVIEVKDVTSGEPENNIYCSRYAENFGDKISLPFNNRFSYITPRFLSKEGNKIFFVLDDMIYGYENKDFEVVELKFQPLNFSNIFKLVAFDNFLFVITKSAPFVHCLYRANDTYEAFEIDLADVEKSELIEKIYDIDITIGTNNEIMFGIIENENKRAYVFYFKTDLESKKITLEEVMTTRYDYDYNFVLCMYKNNYCDSMVIFLRHGQTSVSCRIAYFYPDKTLKDLSTTLAVKLLQNAREVYVKNRAIIVENTTSPSMWIYLYPEIEQFQLSVPTQEEDSYISNSMLYLIQRLRKNKYSIYSLADIENPKLFESGLPSEIDQNDIVDFEFLSDTLLIFTNSEREPILAYNFFQNSVVIENTSAANREYEVRYKKYNLLGSNNEEITVKFTVRLEI